MSIKFLCVTLPHMSIGAGVVVAVTFQQVDGTPNAETSTQSDNQSLKNFDRRVEEFHSLFSFIIKRFRPFVHTRNLVVLRCITAARLIFRCTFLAGIKIKPPTGSGRRKRISVHHDELITGVDLSFSVQIFFNIEGVFWVVVGGQLVVGVLGQVVLVRNKCLTPRSCRMHLPPSSTASSSRLNNS